MLFRWWFALCCYYQPHFLHLEVTTVHDDICERALGETLKMTILNAAGSISNCGAAIDTNSKLKVLIQNDFHRYFIICKQVYYETSRRGIDDWVLPKAYNSPKKFVKTGGIVLHDNVLYNANTLGIYSIFQNLAKRWWYVEPEASNCFSKEWEKHERCLII